MKTIMQILSLSLIIFFLTNCSRGETLIETDYNLHTSDLFNQLDYDIYNLILEEYYSDSAIMIIRQQIDYNLAPIIYISDYNNDDYYDFIKINMPDVDTNAYLDFIGVNDSVNYLDNIFNLDGTVVKLISEEEYDYFLDRDYNEDEWAIFYTKYPNSNGLIELSRIGFNRDNNQAIIEVWHSVRRSGSKGILYFLTKTGDLWKVTNTRQTRTN